MAVSASSDGPRTRTWIYRALAKPIVRWTWPSRRAICGGLTEARRIDALAGAHNLRLAPHLWAGAIAFFAGLHLSAASSSSWILEYSLGANPMLHDLIAEKIVVKDGMIDIPNTPGLGVTVREDVVKAFTVDVA